jgi:hypothetical protein
MNNEPVVWINLDRFKDEALYLADCVSENKVDNMGITTPLYTHPVKEQYKFGVDWAKDGKSVTVVKICEDGVAEVVFMDYQEVTHPAKTLTDEEITEVFDNTFKVRDFDDAFLKFAKAILRKAQEK